MKKITHISGVEVSSEYEDLICYGFDSSIVDEGLRMPLHGPRMRKTWSR